jgi:hypothetical protein
MGGDAAPDRRPLAARRRGRRHRRVRDGAARASARTRGTASRLFFGSTGAAILIVWWLTDYRTVAAPAPIAGRD